MTLPKTETADPGGVLDPALARLGELDLTLFGLACDCHPMRETSLKGDAAAKASEPQFLKVQARYTEEYAKAA